MEKFKTRPLHRKIIIIWLLIYSIMGLVGLLIPVFTDWDEKILFFEQIQMLGQQFFAVLISMLLLQMVGIFNFELADKDWQSNNYFFSASGIYVLSLLLGSSIIFYPSQWPGGFTDWESFSNSFHEMKLLWVGGFTLIYSLNLYFEQQRKVSKQIEEMSNQIKELTEQQKNK